MCSPASSPRWIDHNFNYHFHKHPGNGTKNRECWRECLQKDSDVTPEEYRSTTEEVYLDHVVTAKESRQALHGGSKVTKLHYVDRRGIRVVVDPRAREFDTCYHLHDRSERHLNPHTTPWPQMKSVIQFRLDQACNEIKWLDPQP
jgi:hypothetical protein